jgi:uncharacterized Zn finger protein
MTNARTVCGTCGQASVMAELVVYLRAPGVVTRCRSCGVVLMVITRLDDVQCVDLRGFRDLSVA